MKYAIVGSGKIGTSLARTFARKNIEVAIANSRGPETLASLTEELGRRVPGICWSTPRKDLQLSACVTT
jgi:8-hydroxy-5-deazaflavin:NADPH oxidoreductase